MILCVSKVAAELARFSHVVLELLHSMTKGHDHETHPGVEPWNIEIENCVVMGPESSVKTCATKF